VSLTTNGFDAPHFNGAAPFDRDDPHPRHRAVTLVHPARCICALTVRFANPPRKSRRRPSGEASKAKNGQVGRIADAT